MTDSKPKINIEIPKTLDEVFGYEVFAELETYLYTGFLTSHANIHGIHFVFKSLNDSELRLLDFTRIPEDLSLKSKITYEDYFISYSVFMLNGENFLVDRLASLKKLAGVISKLPLNHKKKILTKLRDLNDKVLRLYPLVEVYCHEPRTRLRWATLKRGVLNDPRFTGIPGSDIMGLNAAQKTFMALSELLDRKEDSEASWNNTKFIAGAFVGKEINKVHDRDKSRLSKERNDIQELKYKVLNAYLNRSIYNPDDEDEGGVVTLPDGRQATVVSRKQALSAQELAAELSSALSQEKDEHDLIVDAYIKKSQQDNEELERERLRSLYAAHKSSTAQVEGSVPLSQIGDENLIQRLNRLRINDPKRSGTE